MDLLQRLDNLERRVLQDIDAAVWAGTLIPSEEPMIPITLQLSVNAANEQVSDAIREGVAQALAEILRPIRSRDILEAIAKGVAQGMKTRPVEEP